jgi:lipid-A-disaccharide synthase-like uncharacterized protein
MIEIGIVGATLLLAAWLFETVESIKKHKALIDLRFASIYMCGTLLLATYSLQNSDMVFMFINFSLLILATFEVAYTFYRKR